LSNLEATISPNGGLFFYCSGAIAGARELVVAVQDLPISDRIQYEKRIHYEHTGKYQRQSQTEYLCGCALGHITCLSIFTGRGPRMHTQNRGWARLSAVTAVTAAVIFFDDL
jgi:hypothetical protein